MSEWQPIESAPKDGTSVLLADHDSFIIGFWNGSAWDDGDFNSYMSGFTHWMPLPSPPKGLT